MKNDLASQKNILVVEDNAAIRELLRFFLNALGNYTISLSASGTEALALAYRSRPDLLLLDYQLPDMSGLTLYDALHTQSNVPPLPAILMSASLPYEELKGRPLIALPKPFRKENVRAALAQAWERPWPTFVESKLERVTFPKEKNHGKRAGNIHERI